MKFKGRLVDHVMLANGEQRLTIQTKDDLRGLFDSLCDKDVTADVKKYRLPRSLDANAYFHLLVNRIAATVGSSDEEVKRELVVRYGTVETDEMEAHTGSCSRLLRMLARYTHIPGSTKAWS